MMKLLRIKFWWWAYHKIERLLNWIWYARIDKLSPALPVLEPTYYYVGTEEVDGVGVDIYRTIV